MNDKKEFPPRVRLGGLWSNTTKAGVTFLSGNFTHGTQIQIWPNKKRDGMKDPDFTIFLSEHVKKPEEAARAVDFTVVTDLPSNEDIPF